MTSAIKSRLPGVIAKKQHEILNQWLELQAKGVRRMSTAEQQETSRSSREFMDALKTACQTGNLDDIDTPGWERVIEILTEISSSRAKGGYTPIETASFIPS